MTSSGRFQPVSWRELLAVGVLINDPSAHAIARCAGVAHQEVRSALLTAEQEGVISNGVVSAAEAVSLVSELAPNVVADVHAAAARYLLSEGPSRLLDAITQFRSAGTLFPSSELAAIADRAARASLSVGDYQSARQFLEFADDVGISDPLEIRAERLCLLASALEGLGLVFEARTRLATAFELAEIANGTDLAVDAAVNYTLPVDWNAGDRRASALLQRAEVLATSNEHRARLQAARSMAEMRIPLPSDNGQQIAWVTRPSVAQPLSEAALASSATCSDKTRLIALIAWRTTHRNPAFLEQRRSMSTEALDIAQRLRIPSRQVDAAVMLAVDAMESGDRPGFDHALAVLRWVAESDKNPRHLWHAYAVASGTAHLDGDLVSASRYRNLAREVGQSVNSPGWLGAELLLLAQEVLLFDDPDTIRRHLPDEPTTEILNPLGKLLVGLGHAVIGQRSAAEDLLHRAIRQFEPEASWLLSHTRAAHLALHLQNDEVVEHMWHTLLPWQDHVAVDSQAWFCDGPVSGWLAHLAHHRGDFTNANRYAAQAEETARAIGDVRTQDRLSLLRASMGISITEVVKVDERLTARELRVLQLMVDGLTNVRIANVISLSPSSVRNDLSSIYRKLGVTTRAEAAAVAIGQGIVHHATTEDAART